MIRLRPLLGLLLGGVLRRALRQVAAVEREVQSETVVVLIDRIARMLQRLLGGGKFFTRVLLSTGGPRRVDGSLRLRDLLLRRIAARGGQKNERSKNRQRQPAHTGHERSIPRPPRPRRPGSSHEECGARRSAA